MARLALCCAGLQAGGRQLSDNLEGLADAAAKSPRLAVILANSSLLNQLLDQLLQAAAELAGAPDTEQQVGGAAGVPDDGAICLHSHDCLDSPSKAKPRLLQARELLRGCDAAVMALAQAASAAIELAHSTGMPNSLAAQLKQAAHSLRRQRRELLSGLAADASVAERTSQLRQLAQPAAGLSALMQQYLALPAVEEGRRLVLARAAAARSCAYLRCANVATEGGPAAGQGVGGKRCRWGGSVCRGLP